MKPSFIIAVTSSGLLALFLLLIVLAHGHPFPLLFPAGSVGTAERDMMLRAMYLMLIVVVPVYALAIFISWHYRENNEKAAYTPEWEQSRTEEFIWWSIPFEIVLVLSALTWSGAHELDPARALASPTPPIVVDVVALPWKWLFIYPEQGVASVNELAFPAKTPIEFHITAAAPMNSFWIPALGGQEYAMTGMTTILHLMANAPGTYQGLSANYSGEGFAQMRFSARAMTPDDFNAWVNAAKASPAALTPEAFSMLKSPSDAGPVAYYGNVTMTFDDIVDEYMPDMSSMSSMDSMGSAHHH